MERPKELSLPVNQRLSPEAIENLAVDPELDEGSTIRDLGTNRRIVKMTP